MSEIIEPRLQANESAHIAPLAIPKGEEVTANSLRQVFSKQDSNRWNMASTSAAQRIAKLVRIRQAIFSHQEELQQAIYQDFGKNPAEVDLTEIYPTISEINHTIRHLKKWMKPKRVGTPLALFGTHSKIHYEPRGLVLVLSPWNYPFNLLINPLVAAIAAGNCVIVKPSSKVPHTSNFIKTFLGKLFDESEVAVFEGSSDVSNELLKLPFDHIFFTGSPRIGKTVMQAAAKNLATVTLELGGKSPVILDETADVKKAAERIMWGKFINAGQTCVAPDYLLIHESKIAAFVDQAKKVIAKRYGETESARKSSPDFCRLVSKGHLQGLKSILDTTVGQGAKIEIGGQFDQEQRYLSPTLLSNVSNDMLIMQEEIFGPILPMITYRHIDEAFKIIRSKEKPLAFYIFSQNKAATQNMIMQSTAGGTCVNSLILHLANPDLPFGGVGHAGMGNYHGHFGFRALSHERAVLHQSKLFDSLKFFYPPYTDFVKRLIRLATKYL